MYPLCLLIVIILVAGCDTRSTLAPVVELNWRSQKTQPLTHKVRPGETLYALAFRYDLDFRQLAAMNHLATPYAIRVGQVLQVRGPIKERSRKPYPTRIKAMTRYAYPKRNRPFTAPVQKQTEQWSWPLSGQIAARFIPEQGQKGINIASKKGEKIKTVASGIVAYAGSGLAGYGNLIIVKHNNHYLTAYGNNSRNLVREGQRVKAGQNIAEIGVIDRRYWGVHFEVRKDGKPVNPLDYLSSFDRRR